MPELLAVGRVARAHGLRGRVLIAPYNAESEGLQRVRKIWLGEREFEVERAERVNLGYLVALRGVADRDQADALRGQEVRVDRAELPALEAGEMYAVDLIGFEVSDRSGTVHGVVEDLEEAGHQDLLRLQGGALVPLSLVEEVQAEARRIVVDAPEGLFELKE
jgi:16S rRNA processing protein RimM